MEISYKLACLNEDLPSNYFYLLLTLLSLLMLYRTHLELLTDGVNVVVIEQIMWSNEMGSITWPMTAVVDLLSNRVACLKHCSTLLTICVSDACNDKAV